MCYLLHSLELTENKQHLQYNVVSTLMHLLILLGCQVPTLTNISQRQL